MTLVPVKDEILPAASVLPIQSGMRSEPPCPTRSDLIHPFISTNPHLLPVLPETGIRALCIALPDLQSPAVVNE